MLKPYKRNESIYFNAFVTRHGFSPREIEVIEYKFKGYFNPKIAKEMGVSLETIKTLIGRIFDKVGDITSCLELSATYIKFLEERDFQNEKTSPVQHLSSQG